jgi:hypothetical protein
MSVVSYDSVMERHTFPNVVGCDLFRAKAMVRYWLLVKTGIEDTKFRIYDHMEKNKLTRPVKDVYGALGAPPISQHANEVIFWYDYKFDAVALIPFWFGSVLYEKDEESESEEEC